MCHTCCWPSSGVIRSPTLLLLLLFPLPHSVAEAQRKIKNDDPLAPNSRQTRPHPPPLLPCVTHRCAPFSQLHLLLTSHIPLGSGSPSALLPCPVGIPRAAFLPPAYAGLPPLPSTRLVLVLSCSLSCHRITVGFLPFCERHRKSLPEPSLTNSSTTVSMPLSPSLSLSSSLSFSRSHCLLLSVCVCLCLRRRFLVSK